MKCEFCGSDFQPKVDNGRAKFCSAACKIMARKERTFRKMKVLTEEVSPNGRSFEGRLMAPEEALAHVTTEHTCPVCGKSFFPRRVTQKTCGKECSAQYYQMRLRQKTAEKHGVRKCAVCGKEFQARRPDAKFCSKECRKKLSVVELNRWHKEHKNKTVRSCRSTVKTCKVCGKEFVPVCMNQKCCSSECSAENLRKLHDKHNGERRKTNIKHGAMKAKYPKRCEWCGKEFLAVTRRVRFCSAECSYKAEQRKRELRFREMYPVRVCVECGKEFQPKRRDQVRCSHECVETARLKYELGVWKANGNISHRVQKKRDALISKVTAKNETAGTKDKYQTMMSMSPDELRKAYEDMTKTEKDKFKAYYKKVYRLSSGSALIRSFRKRKDGTESAFSKMLRSVKNRQGFTEANFFAGRSEEVK